MPENTSRESRRRILIDGAELARLCVDFGIGVLDQTSYTVKKLDPDFFDEA